MSERKNEILASHFFFLDSSNNESSGIFDPKLAKKFEQRALIERIVHMKDNQDMLEKMSTKERAERAFEHNWIEIELWKKQMRELYGEDISS